MVDHRSPVLDRVFRALSDPSRRRMIRDLAAGERSISELAEPLNMSLAAASKHVQALERAGIARRTKRGRTHFCRLNPRPLADAHHWLAFYEQFWSLRLDALDAMFKKPSKES